MQKLGQELSSADFWAGRGADYADEIDNAYHRHRLAVVRSLIGATTGNIVDFGCGDGVLIADFPGSSVIGIDPDPALLDKARDRCPRATLHLGGVEKISRLADTSVDLLLSINVLAYLSDEEEAQFYETACRIVRPGGVMVVTHSNELFDLFTLNSYTVNFHKRNFQVDPSPLLARSAEPKNQTTYNVRENPFTYAHKLRRHGFIEERQEFINVHAHQPLLDATLDYPDTLSVPDSERWKLMFQCSMFGSRSRRT